MLRQLPEVNEALTEFIIEFCQVTELKGIIDLVASVLLKDRRKDRNFKMLFSSKIETDADILLYTGGPLNNKDSWRELKDLNLLARQNQVPLKFYINTEANKTIVEGNFDLPVDYVFIPAVFPRLCPWFFKEDQLDQNERKLLSLFFGKDPAAISLWFKNWADKQGFKQKTIGKFANEITDLFLRQSEGTAKEAVRFCAETREAALTSYLTACEKLKEAQIRLNGIICGQKHSSEELLQYLTEHNNIEITAVNRSGFNVTIQGYLTIVDAEITQKYCENENSFFFTRTVTNESFNDENKKKLIMRLWGPEAMFRLKTLGLFEITGRGVCALSHRQNPDGYEEFIQNPHLYNFGCLGDNEPYAIEAVKNGDVQGALEILTAAVCSMNIVESPTVIALLNQLFTEDRKCIEYNGKLLTPKEALKIKV